jgi:hypothetical protein
MSVAEFVFMNPMVWESLWTRDVERGPSRSSFAGPGADELFTLYGGDDEDEWASAMPATALAVC